TRSSEHFGGPEAALNFRKRTRIIRSAVTYMESTGYEWKIRFDVMAVIHKDG
ncbi:MAG: YraN family protein, partial [Bacteroidota bacterium]